MKKLIGLVLVAFISAIVLTSSVGCGGGAKTEAKKDAAVKDKDKDKATDAPKTDAPKTDAPKTDAPK